MCSHCGCCSMASTASCEMPSGPQLLFFAHLPTAAFTSPGVKGLHGVRLHRRSRPLRICCIPPSTSAVGTLLKIPLKCLRSCASQSPGSRRGSCHPCLRCLCCLILRKAPQLSCDASSAFCRSHCFFSAFLVLLTCFHACLASPGGACCACRLSCLSCGLSEYLHVFSGVVMALATLAMLWRWSCAAGIGCNRCCATASGFLSFRGPHVVGSFLASFWTEVGFSVVPRHGR